MHLEKIRLDKIQNGRLSAIIHFHMAVIYFYFISNWEKKDKQFGIFY